MSHHSRHRRILYPKSQVLSQDIRHEKKIEKFRSWTCVVYDPQNRLKTNSHKGQNWLKPINPTGRRLKKSKSEVWESCGTVAEFHCWPASSRIWGVTNATTKTESNNIPVAPSTDRSLAKCTTRKYAVVKNIIWKYKTWPTRIFPKPKTNAVITTGEYLVLK